MQCVPWWSWYELVSGPWLSRTIYPFGHATTLGMICPSILDFGIDLLCWVTKSHIIQHLQLLQLQVLQFLAHLAYMPMSLYNHDFITIWDHDHGCVGLCGICVSCSWPEYWLQKLYILQIYHIMLLIDAHEIFSQYLVYFLTDNHFP